MSKGTKMRALVLGLLLIGIAGWIAGPAFTEEGDEAPAGGGDPWQEFYEKLGKKGEHHEWMKFMAGSWTTANKFWMGPGDPMESTGKVKNELIMGGRYLRQSYEGDMGGEPFVGEGLMGFDNATQSFKSIWIDSMSTGMVLDEGERKGDKIQFKGKQPSPFGDVATKTTLEKVSDDEYLLSSLWDMPGMGEFKVMEIRYTRVKK